MNDDAIISLIRGLPDRAGLRRLLRHLGFHGAPEPVARPQGTSRAVRTVLRSRRRTLTGFVVELRTRFDAAVAQAVARALRAADPVAHHVLVIAEPGRARVAICSDAPGPGVRHIVLEPDHIRAADVDVLRDLAPAAGESDTAAALRILRALDRTRVGDRFFRDVCGVRDLVSRAWAGVPRGAGGARDALALLFLSRLMFLYFLQRRGLLDGDPDFLARLLRDWRSRPRTGTFYRTRLRTLFFGVLNRRPLERTARARALGMLPYLNGGLFEAHRLEAVHPRLDLPDEIVRRVFADLLEKYRFTATDTMDAAGPSDVLGVDPEMLGRIFEGLMPGERRERTGTFYTPAGLVDRVVTAALAQHLAAHTGVEAPLVEGLLRGENIQAPEGAAAAVRAAAASLRILDPACGSGAFLLGALARLAALHLPAVGDPAAAHAAVEVRRRIVGHALHGVDLLEDAALICSLRLWLALVPRCSDGLEVPPLPNLDRRIRQGDALVDPLDIGVAVAGRPLETTTPPELRSLLAALQPAAARYLSADPGSRQALRRELNRLETALARAWLDGLDGSLAWQAREHAARAADRDLFGEPATHAAAAERMLRLVRQRQAELQAFRQDVHGARRLPFFSFRVHFAEAGEGFDVVLSNPPWVRAHRWPPAVRTLLRERYHVCAAAGWPYAARLTNMPGGAGAQVDLSLLFVEKSLRLLKPGGTFAMLLPAKLFRSLYAGGARELLMRETCISTVEDQGLDHRGVFDADAFTAVVIARRVTETAARREPVRVMLTRASGAPLRFEIPHDDLPLRAGDARSPWLLAPPECREVLRAMQAGGCTLGEQLVIRRGAMTGANDVMVIRDVVPKLGDIARIRAEGWHRAQSDATRAAFAAWIEGTTLRPALRGTDVTAWRIGVQRHVLWTPWNDDGCTPAPPRLRRYLTRHRNRLGQSGDSLGALHRLAPQTLGHKVVWADLAADLRAAAVEPSVHGVMGTRVPVVPLNTVYFMATQSLHESLLLAAYLNSLPIRTFARAVAERAKDAHFRFFAWTLAVLPLPRDWRSGERAARLAAISHAAHARGALDARSARELDVLVAASYGLDADQLERLAAFDAWLHGRDACGQRHEPPVPVAS